MIDRDQVAQFRRDGFLLVDGLFSANEVEALSRGGKSATGPGAGTASLLRIAEVRDLWAERRLTDIARALLDTDKIAFFGEAEYVRFVFEALPIEGRHLHHDAKGTPEHLFNRLHLPAADNYPVVRAAIYLQDYSDGSGGLKVTPGSHLVDTSQFHDTDFQHFNIPSRPGDVIFFTSRLLHSPFAMRLRSDPAKALAPSEETTLISDDPDAFLPWPVEREAIFIDYTREHELSDLLIKSRALYPTNVRTGAVDAFKVTREKAVSSGIGFRADHALVGAAVGASRAMTESGLSEEGYAYLRAMPALCANSKASSPYFPLFSAAPADGDSAAIVSTANELIENIRKYQATLSTARRDVHMNPAIRPQG